jgi:hypothetical protein
MPNITGCLCSLLHSFEIQELNVGQEPIFFQPFNLHSNQEVQYFALLNIFNHFLHFNILQLTVQRSVSPHHMTSRRNIHTARFCPENNITVTIKQKQVKPQDLWGSSNWEWKQRRTAEHLLLSFCQLQFYNISMFMYTKLWPVWIWTGMFSSTRQDKFTNRYNILHIYFLRYFSKVRRHCFKHQQKIILILEHK